MQKTYTKEALSEEFLGSENFEDEEESLVLEVEMGLKPINKDAGLREDLEGLKVDAEREYDEEEEQVESLEMDAMIAEREREREGFVWGWCGEKKAKAF